MVAANGYEMLWSDRMSTSVDVVVIHYSSAVERFPDKPYDIEKVIAIFCEYGVSSHFIIDREGAIFRLVPEPLKAYHCGGSVMPDPDCRKNVNEFSIGIELLATHKSGYTEKQYQALGSLCRSIEKKMGREMTYVGHEDIAGEKAVELGLRSDRKGDPGPAFNWKRFHEILPERKKDRSDQLPE